MSLVMNQESPKIMFNKKKEELCVGQMLNGVMIIGEDKGDHLENPIQFTYQQEYDKYDEYNMPAPDAKVTGVGFRSAPVGDPILCKKAFALEGVPEIQKFILSPIPKSMLMVCNKLSDIEIGGHLFSMYADTMTKVNTFPVAPKKDGNGSIIQ